MARRFVENRLILASHNKGKLVEIAALVSDLDVQLALAGDLGLAEPEETGLTFADNALLKARAAAMATGLPALADDSGLCVVALNDAPGIYSARWAGPAKDFGAAMARVNAELGNNPDRRAYFIAVLALCWPDGDSHVVEGRVDGDLVWPPRGKGGFGYDSMFAPEGSALTFGEMTAVEKKAQSHRARALPFCAKIVSHHE
jgi:XTP/dITP diphosphohydrolase